MVTSIKEIRFSPEIEVELGNDIYVDDIIEGYGDEKFNLDGWEIEGDGSLDSGIEYKPSSNNHLYYNKKTMQNIKLLLKKIKDNGGYLENNCGLHIHVDMSLFSDEEVANIIRNFVKNQNKIIRKFRVYRERQSEWCNPLPKEVLSINAEGVRALRDSCRTPFWETAECKKYFALNLECLWDKGFKTLEFRLFNGTLNYDTMRKHIFWVLQFVLKAKDKDYAI